MLLAMVQASPSSAATLAAEDNRPDTAPVAMNWRALALRDAGMTGSVTTRIELRALTAAEVQPALLDAPGTVSPREAGTRIQELEVASSIRSLLGAGIELEERLWFNADDGLPLQLVRMRQGSKPSQKLYRFGSSQVYRLRRQPAGRAESGQPPEKWSQTSESFYPLPGPDEGCATILESSQLLYLLSSPNHEFSEKPVALCVFDRQRVYRVEFRVLGREPVYVDYLQMAAGQETRIRRTQDALHVALDSRPVGGAHEDDEPFSFLGLSGEIHLLLSDPGRVPLRVRGQVSGFGTIDLELEKLTR
jgi:hypothetical protein